MATELVRYLSSFFDSGDEKYAAGQHYPVTDETLRHVGIGIAELVEIDLTVEKSQALAKKANAAMERAANAAAKAEALAAAARDAQRLADEAAAALEVADVDTGSAADKGESAADGEPKVQTSAPEGTGDGSTNQVAGEGGASSASES